MPKKSAPKAPKPLRLIRLTVQIADTPHNRSRVDELHAAALKMCVQGSHASIKREDVKIVALHTTRPTP